MEGLVARTQKEEDRVLSTEEKELVVKTRHPALKELSDGELSDVIKRLREKRDRAQSIAQRQRREMRGKAAPQGTKPASDDTGTRGKREMLAAAVKRANSERARRETRSARGDLVANAHKALDMKRRAQKTAPEHPGSRTADEGMRPIPDTEVAPSGAFGNEGERPVLERSHKVR